MATTLDVPNASLAPGERLQQYFVDNQDAQRFRVVRGQDGWCAIANTCSGMVLDVVNGSNDEGAEVQQYRWSGNAYQLWALERQNDGSYIVRSKGSGKVLTVPLDSQIGTITQTTFNGAAEQRFDLVRRNTPAEPFVVSSGTTYLIYNENSYLVMDVVNGSLEDGAPVQQYYAGDSDAQRWLVEEIGDGWYRVTNRNSGKALSLPDDSAGNASGIVQESWQSLPRQLWKFDEVGNGYYLMIPQTELETDRCIDVPYASGQPTELQLFECNGTAAQIWRLVRV